jgi:putative ABC transport system permease protein
MLKTAWQFMKYDLSKTLGILFGIIISVFLVGQNLGIFFAILNNMKGIARENEQYIWVVSDKTQAATQLRNIDVRIGREISSLEGVKKVHPLVVAGGTGKYSDGTQLGVLLVGLQGPDYAGGPLRFEKGSDMSQLGNEGALVVDKSGVPAMGNIKVGEYFQINNQRVYVSGICIGKAGFGTYSVFTTVERARSLGGFPVNDVSAYLIEPDLDKYTKQQVIDHINKNIPGIRAVDGNQFAQESIGVILKTSNIAISFGTIIIFAIISGFAIVGLTLFSMVKDRIKDYGTIKAIGGSNSFIRKLIISQALLYSFAGFSIAFGLLQLFKMGVSGKNLEIVFSVPMITGLIIITLSLSLMGSLFGLRKIMKLEPVQIFRM